MKKIMFKDKYGLTAAVLEGRKTMTRRLVKSDNIVSITTSDGAVHHVDKTFGSYHEYMDKDGKVWLAWSPYKVGDILAIAQAYRDIPHFNPDTYEDVMLDNGTICEASHPYSHLMRSGGWDNKMFVRADLMPHHIRITDIKFERLQDISDEDCLREGIVAGELKHKHPKEFVRTPMPYGSFLPFSFIGADTDYYCAKDAFAALIDKVSGKGTWESNPWVFVYSFELVK